MYKIEPLKYAYDALEPYIDEKTVEIHYSKHHFNYLNKLNESLQKANYDYRYSLEDLVNHIDELPLDLRGAILFNAGGVLNHNLYWEIMSPYKNSVPVGQLNGKIIEQYGSFENFKTEFINSASKVTGSGWTFLVLDEFENLNIINTSNQETPYIYNFIPLMGLDLWEHAYYLNYQNRRDEYIANFFEVVDFVNVNNIYEKAIQK